MQKISIQSARAGRLRGAAGSLLPAFLLLIAGSLQAQTLMHLNEGPTTTFALGWSMAQAGDLDGDGITEVLVGANDPALGPGTVRILSVATGAVVRTHLGEGPGQQFGFDVAGGSDADGDGVADVLVGAPGFDQGNIFDNRGRVYVYSGLTGALLHTVTGTAVAENCGFSVAWLGDINADGKADYAVGHSGYSSLTGLVTVHSGADGSTIVMLGGQTMSDRFGSCVAAAGDMTGDGIPDLLVGAPYQAQNSVAGRAYLFGMPTGVLVRTFSGVQAAEHAGWALCSVPDISGDQVRDVIMGAPDYDAPGKTDAGRVRAFDSVTGVELWQYEGPLVHMKAGIDLDAIPDIDSDGVADVIAGIPYIPP